MPKEIRSFTTEDRTLLDLWHCTIHGVPVSDNEVWEKYAEDIFTKKGYRVVR